MYPPLPPQERLNQKKEVESVASQRNILGTQLVKRNEEVNLLNEKIRVQQSTLSKAEAHYRRKQEEKNRLLSDINTREDLLRKGAKVGISAAGAANLKKELIELEREYIQERHKVRT
jgi:hypothetical protein